MSNAKWYASWVRMLPAESAAEKMRNLETADLIESLAAERDALAEKCRQLEARNDTLIAKEVLFDEAVAAGAKMQRERDAAVKEIRDMGACTPCKHYPNGESCEIFFLLCNECNNTNCICKGCVDGEMFEWRGVEPTAKESMK